MRKKIKNIATGGLSCLMGVCLAIGASFALPQTTATAEGNTFAVDKMVLASGTTVTASQTFNDHVVTGSGAKNGAVQGLGVVADSAYTGSFDAIFDGDLEIGYMFPAEQTAEAVTNVSNKSSMDYTNGDFYFTVTDAGDANQYVTIKHIPRDQVSSYPYLSLAVRASVRLSDGSYEIYDRGYYYKASTYGFFDGLTSSTRTVTGYNSTENDKYVNKIKLAWTDDVLTVSSLAGATHGTSWENRKFGWDRAIAFDGTEEKTSGRDGAVLYDCGVPKISFPDGYRVSFGSNYETGTDVVFTSINSVSLAEVTSLELGEAGAASTVTASDGKTYVGGERISLLVGESVPTFYATGYTPATTLSGVTSGEGDAATAWGNVSMAQKTELNCVATGSTDAVGNFTLTVDGLAQPIYVDVLSAVSASGLISSTQATVTPNQTFNGNVVDSNGKQTGSITGLGVTANGAYEANFNAIFKGDLQLNYMFPSELTEEPVVRTATEKDRSDFTNGQFSMTFTDAVDENQYFTLHWQRRYTTPTNPNAYPYLAFAVEARVKTETGEYETFYRGHKYLAGTYGYWSNLSSSARLVTGFNTLMSDEYYNGIKLQWAGDVLSVYCLTGSADKKSVDCGWSEMIKFDGTAEATEGKDGSVSYDCGVPKIDFANGYKISFASEYGTGTDVVFTALNGVSLAGVESFPAGATENLTKSVTDEVGNVVNSGDSLVVSKGTAALPIVNRSYNLQQDFSTAAAFVYYGVPSVFTYNGALDLNSVGEQVITSATDESFTLKVIVRDGARIFYKYGETLLQTEESTVGATGLITMYQPTAEGKIFVGWILNANSDLYCAGNEFDVRGDVTFQAVFMESPVTVGGASVRTDSPYGLRFVGQIDKEGWDSVYSFVSERGILVAPSNVVYYSNQLDLSRFTIDYLSTAKNVEYFNFSADKDSAFMTKSSVALIGSIADKADTHLFFTGLVSNMTAANFSRVYCARSYITLTYADGSTRSFYSEVDEAQHARSAYGVANSSLAAGETAEMLHDYVDSLADITVTYDGTAFACAKNNALATYTVGAMTAVESTDAEGNAVVTYSISVGGNVQAILFNGTSLTLGKSNTVVIGEKSYTLTNVALSEWGEDSTSRTITFHMAEKTS